MRRRCGLFVLWAASVASTPDVLEREALALLDAARNASLGAVATPWPGAGFLSSEVSCFVAYAYARRDCGAAMANVEAALRFQRDDGLVPSYWAPAGAAGDAALAAAGLPSRTSWNASSNVDAAAPVAALPLHGVVALQVYRACGDRAAATKWATAVAPKLYGWHAFLRRARAKADGTVWLGHPLEASAPWVGWTGDAACLLRSPEEGRPCEGGVADARFNAVLARSEVALGALLASLEQRTELTPGASRVLSPAALAAAKARREAGAAGAAVAPLLDAAGRFVSRDARGATVDGGGVADLGAIFAPGVADGTTTVKPRDAAVRALVSATAEPSFACGAFPPADRGCDVDGVGGASWPPHAFARPKDTFFVERGLRVAGGESVADWLRETTVSMIAAALLGNDGANESRFYATYDGAGAGTGRSDDVLTAAAALVFLERDLSEADVDDAPVSHAVVVLAMGLAMALAFSVAFSCLCLNIAYLRAAREDDDRRLPQAAASSTSNTRALKRRSPPKGPRTPTKAPETPTRGVV